MQVLMEGFIVMVDKPTPDELKRRQAEHRAKALASFPFDQIETAGDQALAAWEGLVASGRGAPVVVGDDDALVRVAEMAPDVPGFVRKSTAEILKIADQLRHPDDLMRQHSIDMAKARERLPQLFQPKAAAALPDFMKAAFPGISAGNQSPEYLIAALLRESEPEVGDWPAAAPLSPQLSVAADLRGTPLARAHLVIIPTDDWTTIPAYLRWGNWNACPAPEYHVAALRSWRERFGAELVGLSPDVMNIRVRQKPKTRAEALDLAREQYSYCSDIVEQGVGTLSALAAALMENDWWYFWWD
jgi:Domain of unknown function (DUF4253)